MDQANTVAQLSWRTEGSNRCCEASAGRTLERVRLLVRSSRRSSDALGRRRNPVTMPRPTFPPLGTRYPRVGLARSLAASARQPPVELWVPRAGRCASSQGLARHASQRCPSHHLHPFWPVLSTEPSASAALCQLDAGYATAAGVRRASQGHRLHLAHSPSAFCGCLWRHW